MLFNYTTDAACLNRLLGDPTVLDLLERLDFKRPMVKFSPTGISVKATIRGTRAKLKLGIGTTNGCLTFDIRDIKIGDMMVSVGGDWLEKWVAKAASSLPEGVRVVRNSPYRHLSVFVPGVWFEFVGVDSESLLIKFELG